MVVLERLAKNGRTIPEEVENGTAFSDHNSLLRSEISRIQEANQIDEARKELLETLDGIGDVLPGDHPFTQYVTKLARDVDTPDDINIIALDSEGDQLFYYIPGKTIVISRGFMRYVIEESVKNSNSDTNGGQDIFASLLSRFQMKAASDPIATAIGHERAHEAQYQQIEEDSDETQDKRERQEKLTERVSKSFKARISDSHTREYRADEDGMYTAARGGYNPSAAPHLLRLLGVTGGRYGMDHPEHIDRARRLEVLLADDAHPVPNTDKPPTPIPSEILEWVVRDSDVYSKTEELLSVSSKELYQRLLHALSIQEFMTVFAFWEHTAALEQAISTEHHPLVRNIVYKSIFLQGLEEPSINPPLYYDYDDESERARIDLNSSIRKITESTQLPDVFVSPVADSYWERLPDLGIDVIGDIQQRLERYDKELDDNIIKLEQALQKELTDTSHPPSQELIDMIQERLALISEYRCTLSSGALNTALYQRAFSEFDTTYVSRRREKRKTIRNNYFLREELEDDTRPEFDFADPVTQQWAIKNASISFVARMFPVVGVRSDALDVFSHLLCQETGMNPNTAAILSTTLLGRQPDGNQSTIPLYQYIHDDSQSKETLFQMLYDIEKIPTNTRLLLSPIREAHRSLQASRQVVFGKNERSREMRSIVGLDCYHIQFSITHRLLDIIRRGNEIGNATDGHPPFTLDEWRYLVKINRYLYKDLFNEMVVAEYIKSIKGECKFPDELLPDLAAIESTEAFEKIPLDDALLLLFRPPVVWSKDTLHSVMHLHVKQLIEHVSQSGYGREFDALLYIYNFAPEDKKRQIGYVIQHAVLRYETSCQGIPEIPEISYDYNNGKPKLWLRDSRSYISYFRKYQQEFSEAYIEAIKKLSAAGVNLSIVKPSQYNDYDDKKAICTYLMFLGNSSLESIYHAVLELPQSPLNSGFTLAEQYHLVQVMMKNVPTTRERLQNLALFRNHARVNPTVLRRILKDNSTDVLSWVTSNFSPSIGRDYLFLGFYFVGSAALRQTIMNSYPVLFVSSPDDQGLQSNQFSFLGYKFAKQEKNEDKRNAQIERLLGAGMLRRQSDDLLMRRYNFVDGSDTYDREWRHGSHSSGMGAGSDHQRLVATILLRHENEIFSENLDYHQRIDRVIEIIPLPSVVRDIYIERLLIDELEHSTDLGEKITIIEQVLPHFAPDESARKQYGSIALRLKIALDSSIMSDFDTGLSEIQSYGLDRQSTSQYYFLQKLEHYAPLDLDQYQRLVNLKIYEDSEEDKPGNIRSHQVLFFDQIAELDREERAELLMWLLGFSDTKPGSALRFETEYDGNLNSMPRYIQSMIPLELSLLLHKLLLGSEGVFDIEHVPELEQEYAREIRDRFLSNIASSMIPESEPGASMLRKSFVMLYTSLDAANASQMFSNIMCRIYDRAFLGNPLEFTDIGTSHLAELSAPGIKAGQNIGEIAVIPDKWRSPFRRMQETADLFVPKSGLFQYLIAHDLFAATHGFRVVNVGDLLSAASNKQAALLEIEVVDPRVGLSVGRHIVVGRFKRPSAQKITNINQYMRVGQALLDVAADEGMIQHVPPRLLNTVTHAMIREFDFIEEERFTKEYAVALSKNRAIRGITVTVPRVLYVNDDFIIETLAPGMSLRNLMDHRPEDFGFAERDVCDAKTAVLSTMMSSMFIDGLLHTDMTPGNVFLSPHKTLTVLDRGMHDRLKRTERIGAMALIAGLANGKKILVQQGVSLLGCQDDLTSRLHLTSSFSDNVGRFTEAVTYAPHDPSQKLESVALVAAKVPIYIDGLSHQDIEDASFNIKQRLPYAIRPLLGRITNIG